MARSRKGPQAREEGDAPCTAGYVRYSDVEQDHERRRGVDAQIEDIREHCEERDLDLDKVYKDVKTGRSVDRAEYYKLLERLGQGDYDVLVTRGVSRFGRDEDGLSAAYLIQKARAADVEVQTTSGGKSFNFNDRYDRALFKMLMIVAELEIGSMHARIRQGKNKGAEAGYWVSAPPPTGYDTDGPQGEKVLVPNEKAPLVRELFERYAGGESMRDLAGWCKQLDADMPSYQASIGKILTNETYLGRIKWKGEVYDGQHDGIISEQLWNAVQNVREGRKEKYRCWGHGTQDREETEAATAPA